MSISNLKPIKTPVIVEPTASPEEMAELGLVKCDVYLRDAGGEYLFNSQKIWWDEGFQVAAALNAAADGARLADELAKAKEENNKLAKRVHKYESTFKKRGTNHHVS